jgi:hypothetical protein
MSKRRGTPVPVAKDKKGKFIIDCTRPVNDAILDSSALVIDIAFIFRKTTCMTGLK